MKKQLFEFIPEKSLNLVNYSGKELISRLGEELISNVVLSILCGDNVRNLTERFTQRRILLMNTSLLITYIKALSSYENLSEVLTELVNKEVHKPRIDQNTKRYLLWFVGLTGKSIQNVIREKEEFNNYLTRLDKNLSDIKTEVEDLYGDITISGTNEGYNFLLKWNDLLRCMLAIGASTLSIRGSEKSMYGKLFEKFVMGSALSILGFQYVNRDDTRNSNIFWLSERQNKRESDATALLKPGYGIRFDIGFIGVGNTEVSLDKVTRFDHLMERNQINNNTVTIILIDKIGSNSRIYEMAKEIGGYIIQMSGTYWVYELAKTIHSIYPFYNNPILSMTKEESLDYLKEKMKGINLADFLTTPIAL